MTSTPNTRIITAIAAAALFAGPVSAVGAAPSLKKPATEADDSVPGATEEVNTGQDITKPVRRFDIRYQYQNATNIWNAGRAYSPDVNTVTLRMDMPIKLGNGRSFNTRFDLPMSINNIATSDNRNGSTKFGVNDVLVQGLLIQSLSKKFAVGAGTQLIIPTGSADSFSGNRWRLVPTLGARVSLPQISKGSFFVFGALYDFDFAGDDGRKHTSQLEFSPTLNIMLPDRWFLTLFPAPDIRVNLATGGKWFVPADFMIGKMLNKTTVASVEVSIPIIKDYPLYDFKVEARIGFFF